MNSEIIVIWVFVSFYQMIFVVIKLFYILVTVKIWSSLHIKIHFGDNQA